LLVPLPWALRRIATFDRSLARGLSVQIVWSLVVGLVLGLKYLSSVNYFHELVAFGLLALGASVRRWPPAPPRDADIGPAHPTPGLLLPVCICLILWVHTVARVWLDKPDLQSTLRDRTTLYEAGYQIARAVGAGHGGAIAFDATSALFMPERVAMAPLETVATASEAGLFDIMRVRDAIRHGDICWLVADPGFLWGAEGAFPPDDLRLRWHWQLVHTLLPEFQPAGATNGEAPRGSGEALYRSPACR
jgi:hypothetical protein